jgi:hypothetical protein
VRRGVCGSLRKHVSTASLLGGVLVTLATCATTPTPSSGAAQLMFVQSAEDLTVDAAASTIRLVKVSQQTVYFSDRPQRLAGHITMASYLKEWTARAGKDNFATDPPNATLSVYEPGSAENTLIVITITQPVVDGADLVYSYRLIKGTMPAAGGATSLFIDWIGVPGAGVGTSVGVGGRGVGLR